MADPTTAAASGTPMVPDAPVRWQHWWGLAACAAFMGIVLLAGPYATGVNIAPDKGNWWYYWQRSDADVWSRLSAWLPYSLHQISLWYLIHAARVARPRYVAGLHRWNVLALAVNAFFMLLHILQTRIFYDGLAQDVPEYTSFGSVALMLMMILVMENRRRGMFFGRPAPFMETAGAALRRYHGYYFSWALVYTFWYHPLELSPGHLAGFAYMSLLLLQSSLFFTRFHVNRVWTGVLEASWAVHGAVVAGLVMNKGDVRFWASFFFGGMVVFLVTQLHGLGLSRRGKWLVAAPLLALLGGFCAIYPQYAVDVLTRQPMVLFIGAGIVAGLVVLLVRLARLAGLAGPAVAGDARSVAG
jgi:hypothetical protein